MCCVAMKAEMFGIVSAWDNTQNICQCVCVCVNIHVHKLNAHMKYQIVWFCMLCRVTLWPRCCPSELVHPPLQSLRSPNKLLLPKGAVCVKTHISPQQMVVSLAILSHQPDCLPGLGHLHSRPSRLLASHHPADKILFMD